MKKSKSHSLGLLGGQAAEAPIRVRATNVAESGETRTGEFTWSGTMKLRGVAVR